MIVRAHFSRGAIWIIYTTIGGDFMLTYTIHTHISAAYSNIALGVGGTFWVCHTRVVRAHLVSRALSVVFATIGLWIMNTPPSLAYIHTTNTQVTLLVHGAFNTLITRAYLPRGTILIIFTTIGSDFMLTYTIYTCVCAANPYVALTVGSAFWVCYAGVVHAHLVPRTVWIDLATIRERIMKAPPSIAHICTANPQITLLIGGTFDTLIVRADLSRGAILVVFTTIGGDFVLARIIHACVRTAHPNVAFSIGSTLWISHAFVVHTHLVSWAIWIVFTAVGQGIVETPLPLTHICATHAQITVLVDRALYTLVVGTNLPGGAFLIIFTAIL